MPFKKSFLLCSLLICSVIVKGNFFPYQLSCEHKINPYGIENTKPVLGWWISATERGVTQSAWQILVATSPGKLDEKNADMWNSGRMASGSNNNNAYSGKPLQSARKYYWKVRIWDATATASAWSEATSFTTGILEQGEWDPAKWIAYDILPDSTKVIPGVHGNGNALGSKAIERAVVPCFRKAFVLSKPVKEAFVFISGLGQYELHLNGKKVGDDFLAPGWTNYEKRCLYNTYEVTDQLKQGQNAIGAIVGTGFFYINRERYRKLIRAEGYPMLRARLVIRFTDGSTKEMVTDESWRSSPSPIIYTSIYGGEDYDANKEQAGWDKPGFAATGWKKVLIAKGPGGAMRTHDDYPLKVMDSFSVKKKSVFTAKKVLYDFGQNASAIIRLKVKGHKGDSIRITPAELLNDDGMPEQSASGKPYYFTYILKGGDVETWEPRFTYYGFRYALVEYISTSPAPEWIDVTMLHTRNSSPAAGSFTCSDPLFNNIYRLIDWSIKSNMASVATDCPHREKLGWLEQTHLVGASMRYAYDIQHLYSKIIDDMKEAQLPNGLVPDIAPEYVPFERGFRDSPEWGSAAVIIPWYMYLWYGDKEALVKSYDMMKRYVTYLGTKADNHILSYGLGDWFDLGPKDPGPSQLTPLALTATAIYYYDAVILSKTAALFGKNEDEKLFAALSENIKKAFNDKFFDQQTQVYATGSQTAYAMPLFTGLVEEQYREKVFNNLVTSIHNSNKALTAGDVGYRYLVRALEDGGASQLLYEMNNRDDVPGYGYQLRHGATALTESWPALRYVSNNHMMLGHLMEWLYSGLGGIGQQEDDRGYRSIRIAPQMVNGIDSVSASYTTPNGIIRTNWIKEGKGTTLKVSIPANTTAQIVLPATNAASIKENNQPVTQNKWITHIQQEAGKLSLTVPSGNYVFTLVP